MPRETAREILEQYWDDGSIPVSSMAIASKMGVSVLADPCFSASGHYSPNGCSSGPLITYKSSESKTRQRFTVAHELAHHVMGHGERDRDTPDRFSMGYHDPIEVDANRFAAHLLMPGQIVNALIRVRGIRSVDELARMFGVSKAAMRFRLKELGYAVE